MEETTKTFPDKQSISFNTPPDHNETIYFTSITSQMKMIMVVTRRTVAGLMTIYSLVSKEV